MWAAISNCMLNGGPKHEQGRRGSKSGSTKHSIPRFGGGEVGENGVFFAERVGGGDDGVVFGQSGEARHKLFRFHVRGVSQFVQNRTGAQIRLFHSAQSQWAVGRVRAVLRHTQAKQGRGQPLLGHVTLRHAIEHAFGVHCTAERKAKGRQRTDRGEKGRGGGKGGGEGRWSGGTQTEANRSGAGLFIDQICQRNRLNARAAHHTHKHTTQRNCKRSKKNKQIILFSKKNQKRAYPRILTIPPLPPSMR
jgi:hypothetical protein